MDFNNCKTACKGIDVVFNLIGIKTSPKIIQEKPADIFVSYLRFNTNIIEAARQENVKWFLYVSTIGVYTPDDVMEEDSLWSGFPSKHDWYGGWAKRIGEMQLETYKIQYGLKNYSIVRPANVYGPYDDFSSTSMVIPSLIKRIYNEFVDLKIYIHTWNIFANNISWRNIEINNNIVDDNIIFNYFDDLKFLIKKIIIDDDTKINLIGNLNGNVASSRMPLKGWKNYWYGQYSIINYIYNTNIDKNEILINTRFDLLSNSYYFNNIEVIYFIKKNNNKSYIKNKFLIENELLNDIWCTGVDNIYIGNIDTMYKLIHKFYYELDNIIKINNKIIHQEYLVVIVNSEI
jgi:hypothetical protein